MSVRFKLVPGTGDVPPTVAARQLGLTPEAFHAKVPELLGRGFPAPDPTTGNFHLKAVMAWQDSRNPHLLPSAGLTQVAISARDVITERLARLRGG